MTFYEALEKMMREGHKAKRADWNNWNIRIYKNGSLFNNAIIVRTISGSEAIMPYTLTDDDLLSADWDTG